MTKYKISENDIILTSEGLRRADTLGESVILAHPDGTDTVSDVRRRAGRAARIDSRYGHRVVTDATTAKNNSDDLHVNLSEGPYGSGGDIDTAFLLGVYAGSGMGQRSETGFGFYLGAARHDLIEDTTAAVHRVLKGLPEKIHHNVKREPVFNAHPSGGVHLMSTRLKEFLTVDGEAPQRRYLPNHILASGRDVQLAWLSGFLRTDAGFVSSPSHRPMVHIGISDKQLPYDLQTMLSTFGVHSIVYGARRDSSGNPTLWSVRVTRLPHVHALHDLFDWGKHHEDRWGSIVVQHEGRDYKYKNTELTVNVTDIQNITSIPLISVESNKPIIVNGIALV